MKSFILSIFTIFISSVLFSQNTIETPNLSPDTNKVNNLSIPAGGGGGGGGGISNEGSLVAPTIIENENKNNLELEIIEAPAPSGNKMEEESIIEMEEAPSRGEPVPGAEILIEQEQNDLQYQTNPSVVPTENGKGKNKEKKKNKPNK